MKKSIAKKAGKAKTADRRSFIKGAALAGAGATVAAASSFPAPAVAQKRIEMTMVTTWPRDFPGLGTGAQRAAKRIEDLSEGRIKVQYFAAGERVGAFDSFDAVASGNAQAYHAADYYWKGKHPGWAYFTAVPFGFTYTEMNAWIRFGGGQQLWDELAGNYGLKCLMCGNTGVQMGGWFRKEINSADDLKGLKMRIPGLGGDVMAKLGASPVSLPGGQIYENLVSGAIDATEWVGPWNDSFMKFYEAAKYYYYPGWQEPQSVLELLINQKAFDALPADLQAIVTEAARAATQDMMDDYVYHNALALDELKKSGTLLKRFPDEVLQAMQNESEQVLGELAAQSELNGRIWASMQAFQALATSMQALSEKELYDWR